MYFIPQYILCLFFLIIVDFFSAKGIAREDDSKKRKVILLLSIVSNFGLLFYFKYLLFIGENLNLVLGFFSERQIKLSNDILPIGLSFHTFQSVSYVIDVYRKKINPEKHLGIYSTYVLFFPQMVAGPIERYSGLGDELKKTVTFKMDFLAKGARLILTGFFYKMVIADNCGEYINRVYSTIGEYNSLNVILAICLFSIQIYSDFFGYSLVAQGSAKLFGLNLIDNFSFPFFSKNIVDFWKKWHISLTSWFREYVYLTLGGSRTTKIKHLLNIVIVFTLSGLWHGAGYNFILWGFFHSIIYIITITALKFFNVGLPTLIKYFFTFLIVSFIFIFFRSGKLSESFDIIQRAFSFDLSIPLSSISLFLIFNILFVFCLEFFVRKKYNYNNFYENNPQLRNLIVYSYFLFALLTYSGTENLPFIYFQF